MARTSTLTRRSTSSPSPSPTPSPSTPDVSTVLITPSLAESWLASNTHNRAIRNRQVDILRQAIERGEWKLNGDAVRFAEDGALSDGQHRLWAIALAEKTTDYDGGGVRSVVVRGISPDAQLTIDAGARRSLADHLKLRGYSNTVMLASVINVKWRFDTDQVRSTVNPTVQQAFAVLEANPELAEATKVVSRWKSRLHGSASIGALYHEFASVDPDAADTFFEGVIEGVGLAKDSPLYVLRRSVESTKHAPIMLMALTIKAWNAYLAGKSLTLLSWRPVGKNAEAFPVIAGRK